MIVAVNARERAARVTVDLAGCGDASEVRQLSYAGGRGGFQPERVPEAGGLSASLAPQSISAIEIRLAEPAEPGPPVESPVVALFGASRRAC